MLLIPFIENAFKHGTGFIENPQIDINLSINNNVPNFSVRNKYKEVDEAKDDSFGHWPGQCKKKIKFIVCRGA